MTQVLTVVSILAVVGLLGWGYAHRLVAWWKRSARSPGFEPATDLHPFERPVYKASAQEFLHGVADLTFGMVILALAFFMLMWVIATG